MRTIALLVAVVLCGCAGGLDPEQACFQAADAFADAAAKCGADFALERQLFIDAAAGGDCANITSIRDEDEFTGTCLPALRALTCADLMNGVTPPSCANQLQRNP